MSETDKLVANLSAEEKEAFLKGYNDRKKRDESKSTTISIVQQAVKPSLELEKAYKEGWEKASNEIAKERQRKVRLVKYVLATIGAVAIVVSIGFYLYKNREVLVIGLTGPVSLYEDAGLKIKKAQLQLGTIIEVLSEQDDVLQIKTESSEEGWLRRYCICTSKELERRKNNNQIPKNVICVGYENGETFMYEGSLSITNNQWVMSPGDAVWLDPTMKGKQFILREPFPSLPSMRRLDPNLPDMGGRLYDWKELIGDPSALWLKTEHEGLVRLSLWNSAK